MRGAAQGGGAAGLLLLGVVFHAVYVLSIFDIYFKSPVVAHIESVAYTQTPPAQRLVVFVADGCRADKLFEVEPANRAPFLHDVVHKRGSWGVSHTRVPTESRPGHVAIFAGMYEDVSAVTKGWQDNPVDFDSVVNQSSHAWLFGSPDIVPMLARKVPQAHEAHYSHEDEDFAQDASILDVWVHDQLRDLLQRAASNATLDAQLRSPRVVFFCHFLGIDSNGHAHRPNSRDYLENIALVDGLVQKVERMMEDFYGQDGKTAYVFSADHGMSNKGAHGDGDPANTRTPLVVWGAGVAGPEQAAGSNVPPHADSSFRIDLPTQSQSQVQAQLKAQQVQESLAATDWGLQHLVRKDVMQADIAPLISSLLGLPYPRNSVGVLPFSYLARSEYRARAVKSNAQQLYLHALRKEQEKQSRTLFFFQPLGVFRNKLPLVLDELIRAWQAQEFPVVERVSQEMIAICLDTLEYFQRYDWFFLLSIIVSGYVGWVLVIAIAFLQPTALHVRSLVSRKDLPFWLIAGTVATYLALESSPATYYLYVSFPLLFWHVVYAHRHVLLPRDGGIAAVFSGGVSRQTWLEWLLVAVCLEMVVLGYTRRMIFGLVFTLLAASPHFDSSWTSSSNSLHTQRAQSAWTASCLFISIFPYLPTEYGEHTLLVSLGGFLLLGLVVWFLRMLAGWSTKAYEGSSSSLASVWMIIPFGATLGSMVTMHWTMAYLAHKSKPPVLLTIANWALAIGPVVLFLARRLSQPKKPDSVHHLNTQAQQQLVVLLERMVEVMVVFAPSYILLSISYEVFFYVALCAVLVSWILIENERNGGGRSNNSYEDSYASQPAAAAASSSWQNEVRRAFVFLLLIKIAFFGTGNVASMSSFEISSTYRFVTVFSPFLMGALLVLKILIPFLVVACAFHVILALNSASQGGTKHPPSRYFLLVVGMSDFLALHFLFLVQNEGSWKQIGNSISMFGIVNAQIVFIPLLFLLANVFVRDLLLHTPQQTKQD